MSALSRDFFGSITTFQQRFTRLLFFAGFFLAKAAAFPRSGNSICALIPLGFRYEPAGWDVPVTHHGRS